ncbi:MAG: DUF3857 domain-containing protein [Verrucomicrobiota bacterium]
MKTSRLTNRAYYFFIALTLAVAPVRGGTETNRYADAGWAFCDAKKVFAAAAGVTPEKYPDSDTATIEGKMVRAYRADGTGESQDETFVKALTEKGKRSVRVLALSYTLPYSTVEVVKLEVMKPDGTVVPVDVAANSKDSIDDGQMGMNIFDPNNHVVQVNLPSVEIGDIVHSITRQNTRRAIIPGTFAEENVFEGTGHIRHLAYEIRAPAELPLKRIRLRDEIPGTISHLATTNADGAVTHHWEIANVPRMFEEPGMPPGSMVLQRIMVSTLPDWEAVSKWYWELSKPHLDATTPEMIKTNALLTAGAKTDLDKIKAVFYHVSKNIRYMGLTPEKDRPGFEPHDVRLTFEKNYGVCRDKAALLVAMLREAGLNAYPVLINVGTKRDAEVPDPGFNHAIVGVELEKGDYVLMDPTDENTRDLLPSTDRNQSYLVCRPEGDRLRTSPVEPPERHLMRVKTAGTLSAAGRLEAKSELSFEGVNDNAYRNAFVKMKPDDLRRFFERDLKSTLPGAKLKSLKLHPENMLDMSASLRAELEFSADGMTADGSGKSVVTVPWIGRGLGVVNFILRDTGLEKRKYPLQTWVTCGLEETVQLKLDKGFAGAESLPSCQPADDECLTSRQRHSFTNQTLSCAREFKLKTVEFSPPQYRELKQTLKNLEYDGRKDPVLTLTKPGPSTPAPAAAETEKIAVQSDAKILSASKELEVTDAHTAIYRVKYAKQILSYNGKKREAELKVDYNPARQTAKLIHAAVVSKNGGRHEISAGEINLMDAGWNASAKRYTGGKILVANLPNVEIGSTIEVEFEIASTNSPFLAGHESFQLPDALEQKAFEITAPENLMVRSRASHGSGIITEAVQTTNGRKKFTWTASRVPARPAESQLPPDWAYLPSVGYFIGEADDYFKELGATLLDRARKSSKAAELARQIAATSKDQRETLKAIRDFIAKSIRNAGPAFTELPLAELSAADTTLADGYGHLADRAILLHAMLTAAGFKPEFVMASELPPLKEFTDAIKQLPLPQYFQWPLVRVTVKGETQYLNDTDQYAQPGTTAHDGKLGLSLERRHVETIHAAKDCGNRTDTFCKLALTDDGRARIQVRQSYYGTGFNGKNRYFSELPPEERRRYFQEIVSQVSQGARPVGDLTTRFDTYPGTEEFTVEVDHYAVADGKYYYFSLPAQSLFPAGTDRRALPLYIAQGSKSSGRTEIDLPAGYRRMIIAPKNTTLKAAGGTAKTTLANRNGLKCVLTQELATQPAMVSPEDYPALLQAESTLRQKSARVFLFEKTGK